MKVLIVLSLVAAVFASLEPAGYRPPGSSPSTSYLPPNQYSQSGIEQPSNVYLPASLSSPSNQYLPASHQEHSSHYSSTGAAPSLTYLPAQTFSGPSHQYNLPSYSSLSPSSSRYSPAPSVSYGSPETRYSSAPAAAPSSHYLPAQSSGYSSGYRYNAPEETGPAKYDFEYDVKDQYGNDFGHKESRDGDKTQGVYTVLLPDGRKQIVQYEADQDGYKPRISYEEAKQGYNSNAQQGYPRGPY